MPTVALAVPQTDITVSRNVVRGVTKDIMRTIGFQPDTDIIIKELLGQPANSEGTIDSDSKIKLTEENHVIVGYKESFIENDILSSVIYKEEYPYLFMDPHLAISIRPTYGKVKMEMEITLSFRDQTMLSRFRRNLRMRGGLNSFLGKHNVHYEYSLPDSVIAYLYDAHALRENVNGYGEDLKTYLNKYFLKGLVKRRNQSDSHARLAINEQENNVQGYFSDEIFYDEVEAEEGNFKATINYYIEYHQILGIAFEYPLVIHNQLIDPVYRSLWNPPPHSVNDAERTLSFMGNDDNPKGKERYFQGDGGYRHDPLDSWFPKNVYKDTRSMLNAPLLIDPNALRTLINLHDFTADMIDSRIVDYLITYPDDSIVHYQGLFLLIAYRVNAEEEELTLSIQPNGDVTTIADMSLRDRHYIRISILTDPGKLPYKMVNLLLSDPDLCLFYLSLLSDNVVLSDANGAFIPDKLNLRVVGGRKITLISFNDVVKQIPSTNLPYRRLVETKPTYIANNTVITRRRTDLIQ